MYYTQEQIERTDNVDLSAFLQDHGETLIRSGKEYRWKAHDSLTIYGNRWFRHSKGSGGYPIAFVMEFYEKSFPEAVEMLIGEKGEGSIDSVCAPSAKFRLPVANVTNANAINYLSQKRGISPELLRIFTDSGDIYEEHRIHNIIFVGRDLKGIPYYAHRRGIHEKFCRDVTGSDKSYGFCYQGSNNSLYAFESPIDLLSFINLFPKDWHESSYISLGGISSRPLERFLKDHPSITKLCLCLDNDEAGENACFRIAQQFAGEISVMRIKPIMKDWNELLMHRKEIIDRNLYEVASMEPSLDTGAPVPMLKMSEIIETTVNFLWKPYIPFGKLTMLQGNPGEGKTYIAMQLCAACTGRIGLPGLQPMQPFNVIYQTAEDGLGDTVKPRLKEAGADLDRVLVIDESDGKQLTLSDDRIERAIIQNDAKLFIVDPIQAYIGSRVDMNRANEVRPIFRNLSEVAQRTGCAIVLIGHLNKSVGMQSTYRGLGSIDLTASVRSILFVGRTKDDPNLRVITHEKSSLAPPGASIAFVLGDDDGFRWTGEYDITADELLNGNEQRDNKTKLMEARELICSLLSGGHHMLSEELDREAISRGISTRTLREAKKELGSSLKHTRIEGRRKEFWME